MPFLLTYLGSGWLLVPLALLAACSSISAQDAAALLLIMVFGGRLLVELQKIIVDRDRPGLDEHLEAVSSMSFPSGHSANAMITYMAIALLVPVSSATAPSPSASASRWRFRRAGAGRARRPLAERRDRRLAFGSSGRALHAPRQRRTRGERALGHADRRNACRLLHS
jgi:membrane-associated phospholipid phosphatase